MALQAAHHWHQEGIIDAAALERIEAEYRPMLEGAEGETSLASLTLYSAGGALLGAAAVAFVVLLDPPQAVRVWTLMMLAAVAGAIGFAFGGLAKRPEPADALFVASLVAAVEAAFEAANSFRAPDGALLWLAPLLAATWALVLVWRPTRHALVPAVATLGFIIASAAAAFDLIESRRAAVSVWNGLVLAHLVSVLVVGRLLGRPWRQPVLGLSAWGVAVASVPFAVVVLKLPFWDWGQALLFAAAVQLVLLGAGLALKEKGLVVGASIVLAVDAICFAFLTGGLLTGVLMLLAMATLLLMQASTLKRYLAEP